MRTCGIYESLIEREPEASILLGCTCLALLGVPWIYACFVGIVKPTGPHIFLLERTVS